MSARSAPLASGVEPVRHRHPSAPPTRQRERFDDSAAFEEQHRRRPVRARVREVGHQIGFAAADRAPADPGRRSHPTARPVGADEIAGARPPGHRRSGSTWSPGVAHIRSPRPPRAGPRPKLPKALPEQRLGLVLRQRDDERVGGSRPFERQPAERPPVAADDPLADLTARASRSSATPICCSAARPGGWMPMARERSDGSVRASSTSTSTPRRASRQRSAARPGRRRRRAPQASGPASARRPRSVERTRQASRSARPECTSPAGRARRTATQPVARPLCAAPPVVRPAASPAVSSAARSSRAVKLRRIEVRPSSRM